MKAELPKPKDKKLPDGTIVMHFPPSIVVDYANKWAKSIKEDADTRPEQKAMAEDMATMISIAAKTMTPVSVPAESGKNQK